MTSKQGGRKGAVCIAVGAARQGRHDPAFDLSDAVGGGFGNVDHPTRSRRYPAGQVEGRAGDGAVLTPGLVTPRKSFDFEKQFYRLTIERCSLSSEEIQCGLRIPTR